MKRKQPEESQRSASPPNSTERQCSTEAQPEERWEKEHRWALFEEARRVIDAGQFGTTIERNRQIADRLSERFPHVNPRFSDETVRTQLRTLGRLWRTGTVMQTYSGKEVVACSTDLLHTLFPETTSASEDTQSVPGGSMTVTCSTRRIKKTARLVESLPGLTATQKAQAALILKDKDNLTWFLSWEDPEVRLEWIKEKLGLGATFMGTEPGSSSAGAQIGRSS